VSHDSSKEAYPGEHQDLVDALSELNDRLQRACGERHPIARMITEALVLSELAVLRVAMDTWRELPERRKRLLLGEAIDE
jgi:hypothetical protein